MGGCFLRLVLDLQEGVGGSCQASSGRAGGCSIGPMFASTTLPVDWSSGILLSI